MNALDRARRKAYLRIIPLLFVCYMVAYIDRANIAIAKLTMGQDLPDFNEAVLSTGAGMFFLGYVLLEIPGTLLVEKWSARKWLGRIMITWGVFAALQAFVRTKWQFYGVRFLLGLGEAGFFPGVVVYLSHWFPSRDRARAVALFLMATPMAQLVNPKLSNALLGISTTEIVNGVSVQHAGWLGLVGWQWVFLAWAVPAVVLGVILLLVLPDKPKDARWLTPEERDVLSSVLASEKLTLGAAAHMPILKALRMPKILGLAVLYALAIIAYYGIELFTPSILKSWYRMDMNMLTWLLLVPAAGSLLGQLFVGWNSDRTQERRLHAAAPLGLAAVSLALLPLTQGHLGLTLGLFTLATIGIKSYLPAFWCMPSLLVSQTAAAASTGFINSVGNLGGFIGPHVIGQIQTATGSFVGGLYFIAAAAALAALGVFFLGIGRKKHVSGSLVLIFLLGFSETGRAAEGNFDLAEPGNAPVPVRVERSFDSFDCPDAVTLARAANKKLGRTRFEGDAPVADVEIAIRIMKSDGFRVAVMRTVGQGTDEQIVSDPGFSCRGLEGALVAALEAKSAHLVVVAKVEPRGVGFLLGAGLGMSPLGAARVALGTGIDVPVSERATVRVGWTWESRRRVMLAAGDVKRSLWWFDAGGCFAPVRGSLTVDLCAQGALGRASVRVPQLATTTADMWLAAGAGVVLDRGLGPWAPSWLGWFVRADGWLPLLRDVFDVTGFGETYRPPVLFFHGMVGLRIGGR